jgi:hypothetical protein
MDASAARVVDATSPVAAAPTPIVLRKFRRDRLKEESEFLGVRLAMTYLSLGRIGSTRI